MTRALASYGLAVAGLLAGAAAVRPTAADYVEFAAWVARPAVLPFAWNSLEDASRRGDPLEAFARAQHLLRFLPRWTDGHCAFAYRYALAEDAAAGTAPAQRAARALTRLELALAWMQSARATAGRHELGLLQALAFLPEVAVRREPGLADLLRDRGGPAAMADPWLAEAERRFPSAAVRENRTFHAPGLAAGLLAAGDPAGARTVLAAAVARSHDVRDQQLASVWRLRLTEALARLDGDRTVDLAPLAADARFAALLPHLR